MADEKLVKVKIIKKFTLTHDNGTQEVIEPGDHEFRPHIAEHWWVKAHSDQPPKSALTVGTPEHAKAMKLLVESRRQSLAEAEALYEEAQAAAKAEMAAAASRKPGPTGALFPPDNVATRESIIPLDNAEQGGITGGPAGASNGQEGFDPDAEPGAEPPSEENEKPKIKPRAVIKA